MSARHDHFPEHDLINNNGRLFEISIEIKSDQEKERFDQAVGNTILHILLSNIFAKGDMSTFFYVCDISGGRGKARAKKFNTWYKRIKNEIPLLELYDFILPGYDNEFFYVSLLIFNNHPKHIEYVQQFERLLNDNFFKR